jgi:hypothetical protein
VSATQFARRIAWIGIVWSACATSAAAQTTAFFYESQQGDYVGQGKKQLVNSDTATFAPSLYVGPAFLISGPVIVNLSMRSPAGRDLPVGTYVGARAGVYTELAIGIDGRECSAITGRFVILEAEYQSDGRASRFAVDFESHCEPGTPGLVGAFRYNSTISTVVPFGGQYFRYSIDITAADHGMVTGGSLSCGPAGVACHADFAGATSVPLAAVPDPGYMFAGWTGDCAGISRITLSVNQPRLCAAVFEPIAPTSPRTLLLWNSASGDPVGNGDSGVFNAANSEWTVTSDTQGRVVTIQVDGNSAIQSTTLKLQFGAPVGEQLQPGRQYTGANRNAIVGTATGPGIRFIGNSLDCTTNSGQFTVREFALATDLSVSKLAIDFENHCGSPSIPPVPPTMGTIEYNATTALPTLSLSRNSLTFATTATLSNTGFVSAAATPPQTVRINAASGVSWYVSADQPWLSVSPRLGTGPMTLTAWVNPNATLPPASLAAANLTFAVSGASNNPGPVAVSLVLLQNGATQTPFGSFDTPLDAAAGVSGSIAVSGWALDDIGVTTVRILRDPVGAEPPGQPVFIGNAVLIDGARPDVAAAFPGAPRNSSGGWGYLLLTNFLPNQGNGTFRLYAFADDVDGHSTLLGTKTIVCDNAHATAPFGAIDTPGQGDVVSGLVANYGWVLSPGSRHSDPPDGGSVTVFVDGAPVGSPGGWNSRSDLSALFPVSSYSGVDTALGVYGLDTSSLTNGVHTISWSVTDNLGATSGIGSRFFTVSNASSVMSGVRDLGSGMGDRLATGNWQLATGNRQLEAGSWQLGAGSVLLGRRGFDLNEPLDYYFPDFDGVVTIDARELDRIELQLEPGATGVLITAQGDKPLPIGAQIDPATGVFTWAPGAGFVGAYEFMLDGQHVRIVIHSKSTGR